MKSNTVVFILIGILGSLFFHLVSIAAIPLRINHQGLVKISGAPFEGVGEFSFALVDGTSGQNLWTNDGSQLGTSFQPASAVTLSVTEGLYSVDLGNAALANMTVIPSSVFATDEVRLRIWFNDGSGAVQLSPDLPMTSAPYAYVSARAEQAAVALSATDSLTLQGETPADFHDASQLTGSVPTASLPSAVLTEGENLSLLANDAGFITDYTEVDTLDSVSSRGATTENGISVGFIDSGSAELSGELKVLGQFDAIQVTSLDTSKGIYHYLAFLAQTFTPSISGSITSLRLPLRCNANQNLDAIVKLIDDAPTGSPLTISSTETITVLDTTVRWYTVYFDSPVSVAAGQTYAIVVEGATASASSWMRTDGSYPGGDPYYNTETWVLDSGKDLAYEITIDGDPLFSSNPTAWQIALGGPALLADQGSAPSAPTNQLYNLGGNLFWNESQLNASGLAESAAQYVLVKLKDGNSDAENASALGAAYLAARQLLPNATNRIAVIVPPGRYNLGTGALTLDTPYLDLIGLTTDRAAQFIYGESNGPNTGVLMQTADPVRIENLTVQCTRSDGSLLGNATDPAAYFPNSDLPDTTIRNCEFIAEGGTSQSTRTTIEYSGTYENCIGGDYFFGGLEGTASGTFDHCSGGDYSFGGRSGLASGTFSHCSGELFAFGGAVGSATGTFHYCTGGNMSFGGSHGTASGEFYHCVGEAYSFGGNYGNASGLFDDCRGDSFSFGGSRGTASGTFIRCSGDNCAFGGGTGSATGTFHYCIGGSMSFGGSYGIASGEFNYCIGDEYSFGGYHGTASGHFDHCRGASHAFGGSYGTASGTFNHCHGKSYSFGGNSGTAAGGKFYYCNGEGIYSWAGDEAVKVYCIKNDSPY